MQNNNPLSGRILRSARVALQGPVTSSRKFSAYPPNELKVTHDESGRRFFIQMGTECAELFYEKENNILDMVHTEVPSIFRGQGVGAILAKEVFSHVVENDLKMKLSCDYLQKYFKENSTPELKKRLA